MSVITTASYLTAISNGTRKPLNHPRIAYATVTEGNTPTVSSTRSGFFAGALSNLLTHESWSPSAPIATVEYTFTSQSIGYVSIPVHDLGTNSVTVTVKYSTGGSYTTIGSFSPSDDTAILYLFAEVTATNLLLEFSYGGSDPIISVITAGQVLEMERALYGGHTPITLARSVINRPQMSESGQWIGSSRIRQGFESSASFRNLKADWYRANFDAFVAHAMRGKPFVFAWNPDEWPGEVAYCWASGAIKPDNMGVRDLMQVSFSMMGYAAND